MRYTGADHGYHALTIAARAGPRRPRTGGPRSPEITPMTSITSSSTALYGAQRQSPRDRLQSELTAEVAAGTISSTDENALSTALDAIDKSLSAGRASGTSSTTPPSPDEMKQKISDLIGQQVEDGSLTADQAKALQSVFRRRLLRRAGRRRRSAPGAAPVGRLGILLDVERQRRHRRVAEGAAGRHRLQVAIRLQRHPDHGIHRGHGQGARPRRLSAASGSSATPRRGRRRRPGSGTRRPSRALPGRP